MLRGISRPGSRLWKIVFRGVWISLALFIGFALILFLFNGNPGSDILKYRHYFLVTTVFIALYLPKAGLLVFLAAANLKNLFYPRGRDTRFSNILGYSGIAVSVALLLISVHGIFIGRSNFITRETTLYSPKLPPAFDGLRLVHFSDAHLGSFINEAEVAKGLAVIEAADPDLLVFSGDMINVAAEETRPYINGFLRLDAELGKFATLGNHDMEDYARWDRPDLQKDNPSLLMKAYNDMGFRLLRDEHEWIRRGTDSILIAGVDNWGLPPFHKYGNLKKALGQHSRSDHFTILISHDPSHWRAEVMPFTDVDLMLSGHTHGMQFGIRTDKWSWSPSQWKYPEWLGLYSKDGQHLYVNAGFGFLGFIGRIGIFPEITIITLKRAEG
jgi:hypothetical protein